MVFYVRTRRGYDELVRLLGRVPSPLWVDCDVLTDRELFCLREAGSDVTNFTIEPTHEADVSTIQLHHPDEIIWVESQVSQI